MLVFQFDAELAATSAEDFVARPARAADRRSGVVTGEDFTFGKGRGGNVDLLRELGPAHGIAVEAVAPVLPTASAVSSSRIREALHAGDSGPRRAC